MKKRRAIKLESETRQQLAGRRDDRQGDMASGRRGGSHAPERDQTETKMSCVETARERLGRGEGARGVAAAGWPPHLQAPVEYGSAQMGEANQTEIQDMREAIGYLLEQVDRLNVFSEAAMTASRQ